MARLDVTGDHLRLGRLALRWTQADLARESGVSKVTISNLETRKTVDPKRATLAALARALERHGVELAEDGSVRVLDMRRGKG